MLFSRPLSIPSQHNLSVTHDRAAPKHDGRDRLVNDLRPRWKRRVLEGVQNLDGEARLVSAPRKVYDLKTALRNKLAQTPRDVARSRGGTFLLRAARPAFEPPTFNGQLGE